MLLHVGVWRDEGDGFEEDLGLEVVEEVVVGEVVGAVKVDIPTGEPVDDGPEVSGGWVDADHLEHLPIGGIGGFGVDGHGGFPSVAIVEGLVLGDPTFTVGGEVCEHEKGIGWCGHCLCLRMVGWLSGSAPCKRVTRGKEKAPRPG